MDFEVGLVNGGGRGDQNAREHVFLIDGGCCVVDDDAREIKLSDALMRYTMSITHSWLVRAMNQFVTPED